MHKHRLHGFGIFVCIIIISLTLSVSYACEIEDSPFNDISPNMWYYNDILYVYNNKLMNGTETCIFSPDDEVSRSMLITVLYRLAGEPRLRLSVPPFSDLEEDGYYTNAVNWGSKYGIIKGYEGGAFGPDDAVTREQMSVILVRYCEYTDYHLNEIRDYGYFADEDYINWYAKDSVKILYTSGILHGNSNSEFMPQGKATRAELSALIRRYTESAEKNITIVPKPNYL